MSRLTRSGTKERKDRYQPNLQPPTPEIKTQEVTIREQLQAVRFVLEESLSRVERLIENGIFLTTNRNPEFDDDREFFVRKLAAIRQSLQLMAERLAISEGVSEGKRILQLELFSMMAILETSRANRLVTDDSEFSREVRQVLGDSIEDIVLDLLNLRARTK